MPNHENIGIIVLAAGYSRRFEGDKRKARLNDQRTVLESTLLSVPSTISRRILVLHPGDEEFAQGFHQWQTVIADKAANGMGDSLAAGIRATIDWQGALIALGDMPYIEPATFNAVAESLRTHSIVIPVYTAVRGHPVGFQKQHFDKLAALSGDTGARTILKNHAGEVFELQCLDRGVIRDIDKPADITGTNEKSG
jgi:molybdenum cofactor cytidylyltransferase